MWQVPAGSRSDVKQLSRTSFCEASQVFFKPLTSQDIDTYLACGESMDKAGAYAIQGQGHMLVDHYEGDWDNIVGLPVTRLLHFIPPVALARSEL